MTERLSHPNDLTVLHEDEHVLVVDKPAFLLTVGAPGRTEKTLLDLVQTRFGRLYPVHRLDEETTGALAFARTIDAREGLEMIFRERRSERLYLALCARVPSPPSGRIESRLVTGEDGIVRSETKGDLAITTYRTLTRRSGGALVACRLMTGRRNQIRAHLSELGAPLCGDRKYGWRPREGDPKVDRTMLHAWRLAFDHPIDGSRVSCEAEPPDPRLRPSASDEAES
ncbi:MAG: RluA family pseudouridine synthase [Planctomycetota bacterium]